MNTQLDQLATAVAARIAARQSAAEQAEAERQAKYAAAFDTIVAYLRNRWQGSGLEALIGPPTVVNGKGVGDSVELVSTTQVDGIGLTLKMEGISPYSYTDGNHAPNVPISCRTHYGGVEGEYAWRVSEAWDGAEWLQQRLVDAWEKAHAARAQHQAQQDHATDLAPRLRALAAEHLAAQQKYQATCAQLATTWRAEVWRPFTLHRLHITPVDVRAPKDDALAEWDEIVVMEEPTQIAAALHTEGVARVRAVSTWGAVSEWTIFGVLKAQRLAFAAAPALDEEIAYCRRFKVGDCCVNVPPGVEGQPPAGALPAAPPSWYAVVTERLGRKVLDKLEYADLGPAEVAVAVDAQLLELLAR
jgi:hypothetical protein